ncbi:MAG TPA: hypothetical protein PLR65_11145, partial [Anaerolineales bacterium]|nr:hypothetical protein [Anaerolineales bacterium]
MSTVIAKICSMPKNFRIRTGKSITQLFNETGYLKEPKIVSKEALIDYLKENPELIEEWENYSGDKHYSPNWYFLNNDPEWIVGYASAPSQEQKRVYQSRFEACAEFILHELEEIAEHAT